MKKLSFFILFLLFLFPVFAQNHKPTAVDDYYEAFRGEVQLDPLSNDYDVDGDSIYIFIPGSPHHGYVYYNSQGRAYNAFSSFSGTDTIRYVIREFGTSTPLRDTALMIIKVDNSLSFDFVDVNNIKAGVKANGFLFCDIINGPTDKVFTPMFEYPKGSGIKAYYSGNLWVGGIDDNDSLHLAAQRYVYYGYDYSAGPVSSVYDHTFEIKYKRLWKITRADIDYHIAHCWQPHYVPSQVLLDWPGNGDVSQGESAILAPFYDNNHDGIYDPYAGDYPLIKGDETVLFIFNDDRYPHKETGGKKLGIEVIGMLYAFDCPSDSALWNSIFLHFDIANRSANTYHDAFIGTFVDNDLGYAQDDLIGCDVSRGSFYCYNGVNIDGVVGASTCYGYFPPAESVTVLGGPFMDPDGMDNPSGNCDEGLNGLNFGNNIIDDERYGLSYSGNFYGIGGYYGLTVPELAPDYYNYLHGHWKDSVQMVYWGIGHPIYNGTGPACRYLYPNVSDPCHYGTCGIDPGGTDPWTEEQTGNPPYDRRSYGSSGPFTFHPGDIVAFDLAFVMGRNFADTNARAAIPGMQQRIDSIRSYFIKDKTPCGDNFSGYKPPIDNPAFLYVYPNPTYNSITLEFTPGSYTQFEIFDILGNEIAAGNLSASRSQIIDLSFVKSGLYFLKVNNEINTTICKIIKIK